MDGGADAAVGAAATDVAGHGVVDVGVTGRRVARQQRGGGHDLARLAVAALGNRELDPRELERVLTGGVEALDGGHGPARRSGHRREAAAYGLPVQVDRAGAALADAAAELRAGETDLVRARLRNGASSFVLASTSAT